MLVSTVHDSALEELVRRLVEGYAPERVYLFGSQARGDAGPDSDYDLLLVIPDDAPASRRSTQKAHEVLWDMKLAADVLIWPRQAFERLHLNASFPSTIVREGRLLYGG